MQLTVADGLTGALQYEYSSFITSPNVDEDKLPEAPLGSTRNTFRRDDGRYGLDDPCQWPQFWNKHHPYMVCVRNPSFYCPDGVLRDERTTDEEGGRERWFWWNISSRMTDMDMHGGEVLWKLNDEWCRRLSGYIEPFLISKCHAPDSFHHKSAEMLFKDALEDLRVYWNRLKADAMPLRDLQRGWSEVQRCALVMDALTIYMARYRSFCEGSEILEKPRPRDREMMGAFVDDERVAHRLFFAGIPVYFVRHYSEFKNQVILR